MGDNFKLRLPLARVKKISKIEPTTKSISVDAAKLLALTTEKYIELLAKYAWNWALANSRKTLQMEDIEQCIRRDWMFAILENALTDWPEEMTNKTADGEEEDAIEEEATSEQAHESPIGGNA